MTGVGDHLLRAQGVVRNYAQEASIFDVSSKDSYQARKIVPLSLFLYVYVYIYMYTYAYIYRASIGSGAPLFWGAFFCIRMTDLLVDAFLETVFSQKGAPKNSQR